jgi:hypothetical protein
MGIGIFLFTCLAIASFVIMFTTNDINQLAPFILSILMIILCSMLFSYEYELLNDNKVYKITIDDNVYYGNDYKVEKLGDE